MKWKSQGCSRWLHGHFLHMVPDSEERAALWASCRISAELAEVTRHRSHQTPHRTENWALFPSCMRGNWRDFKCSLVFGFLEPQCLVTCCFLEKQPCGARTEVSFCWLISGILVNHWCCNMLESVFCFFFAFKWDAVILQPLVKMQ